MCFEFNGYVGEEFTPEEEAAIERIITASPSCGETPDQHCDRVCYAGYCDLLPCPKGLYGVGRMDRPASVGDQIGDILNEVLIEEGIIEPGE